MEIASGTIGDLGGYTSGTGKPSSSASAGPTSGLIELSDLHSAVLSSSGICIQGQGGEYGPRRLTRGSTIREPHGNYHRHHIYRVKIMDMIYSY